MSLTNTAKWQYTAWLIDWLYTFFLLFHSYSIWKLSVHVKGCKIKTSTFKQAYIIIVSSKAYYDTGVRGYSYLFGHFRDN